MRAILIQQGLDSALDDDDESKSKKEKEEGSSGSDGNLRTKNNKAHSTIILHLSDEVLREVAKEKTASGLWAKLEEIFLKKSLAKRLYIKMKLYTFSIKEGTIMKDHLDELNKLILDFENVSIILDDEDMVLILLSSLPDTYEHFVDTLLHGRQTLTLKDVKNALESKDLKRRADGKDHIVGDVLVAKAKTEKKGCSFHMCPYKDFFVTFENVDGGKVLLGNNLACKVAGIGYVIIKMYDGTVRSLEQILKGGTVIMKSSRRNGLYVLNGSVVLPDLITNGKLKPKAVKGYFIGYLEGVKGYKLWCIDGKPTRTLISRDVVFDEEFMLHKRVEIELITHDSNEDKEHNFEVESSEDKRAAERDSKSYQKTHITSQTHDYKLTRDREMRFIKLSKRYGIADMISYAVAIAKEVIGEEPINYKQATSKGTADAEPPKYKTRLVAKGFTQKHGVDFNETAFLHGSLEEEILMDQPEGFIEEGTEDMEIERLKMELNFAFEIKDLGTATRILGMQIVRDRNLRTLFLTQAVYVKKVLSRFEMSGAKSVSVPLSAHFRLSKLQEPEEDQDLEYMKTVPYSSAVGSIMYSIVCTRPDVAHGVMVVSSSSTIQLSKNPKYHERTKHIDVKLHFVRDEIANGVVNVVKVPTQTNPANILTKAVPAVKFRNSLNLIGVDSL
ncbi:CCHC-type domain-containing protein [Citrus sinensis]|nr:CCHC-type domain-containing protein [Citrus sinensis]